MSTKTCPECSAEVPQAANRCKECFHDFAEDSATRGSFLRGPLVLMLGVVALMGLIGTLTFALVLTRPTGHDVVVDQPTESVVFTTHYRSGAVTDRVYWKDIVSVEHNTKANGDFEVLAVTLDGSRHVLQSSSASPLTFEAEMYAELMKKPVVLVDHSPGFGAGRDAAASVKE